MVNPYLVAAAITHLERYSSRRGLAASNKNPGNLRNESGAYLSFPSIDAGWWQLVEDILVHSDATLGAYLAKIAHTSDGAWRPYVHEVCALTGYSHGTKIGA